MAVKLRLTRVGKTKQPQYRIVAADSRSPADGRFIEIVGHYNPLTDPSSLTVDNDKAVKWLQQGAQPTDRVRKLLEISGALEQFTASKPVKAVVMSDADDGGHRHRRAPTRAARRPRSAVLTHIVTSIVDDPAAVKVEAHREPGPGAPRRPGRARRPRPGHRPPGPHRPEHPHRRAGRGRPRRDRRRHRVPRRLSGRVLERGSS